MTYFVGYIAILVTFVVADMAWLSIMTPRLYRPILRDILISSVNLPPGIIFYLLYPLGLLVFVVSSAFKSGSIETAIVYGALFGFFTYATYDLTNYATLRNWTLQLTLADVAWGTILAAIASAAAFWVVSKLIGVG